MKRGGSLKKTELKKLLGDGYRFEQHLNPKEVRRLQDQPAEHFPVCLAASLTAGCVRIDAILFQAGDNSLRLGYEVFAKDSLDTPEWICYDSPEDEVILEETQMLAVLDRVVQESNLSYTECRFRQLDGKEIEKGFTPQI